MNTWLKSSRSRPLTKPSRQVGVAAVELAIVIVVLLLMLAGTIGFGRTFWYLDALTKATRDGARLLSTWEVSDISAGVAAARNITINSANAANLSPPLASGNVVVECLNDSFAVMASCSGGTAPRNVRVRITGFNVTLGEWFPFIATGGAIDYGSVGLSPHTTMPYMNY